MAKEPIVYTKIPVRLEDQSKINNSNFCATIVDTTLKDKNNINAENDENLLEEIFNDN